VFDLQFNIALKQIEAEDVNAMVEGITDLIRLKLGRGRVSFHVDVEPVKNSHREYTTKAA
jgi:phage gp45-like